MTQAQSAFLTNSLIGVRAVSALDMTCGKTEDVEP